MNYEEIMMQLILHGGNARGAAYEALDYAEEYNFDQANELLEEAKQSFLKAHKYQTQVVQSQEEGTVPTFFMIHAQDHVMTAQAELELIKRMITQMKEMKKLTERIEALEKT